MKQKSAPYFLSLARIGIGAIFLWAFIDKTFGFNYSTSPDQAWLAGGSPTTTFLNFATSGPFAEYFQALAGFAVVDGLFMAGLGLIGGALLLGIGVKVAAISGSLLLLMMYLATFPPEHNPVINDHIVYSLILLGLAGTNAEQKLGLGRWWRQQRLVKSNSWLE